MPWSYGGKVIDWEEEIQNLTSPLTFMGKFDPKRIYNIGDIIIENDITYCYSGSEWVEFGSNEMREEVIKEENTSNCRNCGSSLFYNGRCAYCGTLQPTTRRY